MGLFAGDRAVLGQHTMAQEELVGHWPEAMHGGQRGIIFCGDDASLLSAPSSLPAFPSLGTVPKPCCQHLLSEPGPGKCSHEVMGRSTLAGLPISRELWQVHVTALGPAPL